MAENVSRREKENQIEEEQRRKGKIYRSDVRFFTQAGLKFPLFYIPYGTKCFKNA